MHKLSSQLQRIILHLIPFPQFTYELFHTHLSHSVKKKTIVALKVRAMLSEHEIVAFCILRKTSFTLISTSFFIVSSGFLWPTFYNINDNITLVDVIPWVFLSRLPSQKTVLCCLLVILLSTILHPRTAHFNCPDSLSLWYANLLIHTVSLDTLSHHPVSLHYRAELFPCELMCFSNQHLTPFLSRFLIKHLNGPHEKVWVLIHFHRCLGFSEFISLFNWCGPCPLLALDRT